MMSPVSRWRRWTADARCSPPELTAASCARHADVDEDLTLLDLHGEAPEKGQSGTDALTAAHVVQPLVDGAGQDVAVQPAPAQRHALMRAPVLVGVDHTAESDHEDPPLIDQGAHHVAILEIGERDDRSERHQADGTPQLGPRSAKAPDARGIL